MCARYRLVIQHLYLIALPFITVSTQTMPIPRARALHTSLRFICSHTGCNKGCRSPGGLKRHIAAVHPKHVEHPVPEQPPTPAANPLDEDDIHPGGVDPASPPQSDGIEPPLQAVTHYHPTIDGQ